MKPANIKIRPDGVVKILDFGLALAQADAGPDAANSPTMIGARTEAGNGESTTDILAAVVQSEPTWSALPAGVPARAAAFAITATAASM